MSFLDKAKKNAQQTAERAKSYAAEHKDKIDQAVDKVETVADQRTGGRYHDKIAKAGDKVAGYVDKLPAAPSTAAPTEPDTTAAAATPETPDPTASHVTP